MGVNPLNLVDIAILNLYSLLFLLVIIHQHARQGDLESPQKKLFMGMMVVNAVMLVLDVIGRFDGAVLPLAPFFNHTGNFFLYLLSPVLPACWVLYVYLEQKRSITRPLSVLAAIFVLHAAGVVFSLRTGWFYTIDSNNIFHRGPYYILSASLLAGLLLAGIVSTLVNRHRIDENHYRALSLFPLPTLAAVALQTVFYGKSLMLNAGVLSILDRKSVV